MKKIVFVAWVLSFCLADVLGMLPNRKGSGESPPLRECTEDLIANPSAGIGNPSAKSGNCRKRELSPSCEGVQENKKRRESSKADESVSDLQRVVGLRKRMGIKEKKIEELCEKIASLRKQKEKGEQIIEAVNNYLDTLVNKYKDLINSDLAFMEHYLSLSTVFEKVEFLMSSAILKLEEHSKSISRLNRILDIGVAEVQKLQRKNESNEKRISELERKEMKYQELSGQIDQLSQVVQNQGDRFKQIRQDLQDQGNITNVDEKKILGPISGNCSVGCPPGYGVEQNVDQKVRASEVPVAVGASDVENHAPRGDEELFENAAAMVKIKGRFIDKCLDFSKPVWFEGEYLKNQQFVFSGPEAKRSDFISNSERIKISTEDLSKIDYTREVYERLYIALLNGTGVILCNKFVYQGEVDKKGNPNGLGIMLKSTGEMDEGMKTAEEWLGWLGM